MRSTVLPDCDWLRGRRGAGAEGGRWGVGEGEGVVGEGKGQVDDHRFQWKERALGGGSHLGCGDNVQEGHPPLSPSLGPGLGAAGLADLGSVDGVGGASVPPQQTHAPCSGPCLGGWGTLWLHLGGGRWWGGHLGGNLLPQGEGTLSGSGVGGGLLQRKGPEWVVLAVPAAAAGGGLLQQDNLCWGGLEPVSGGAQTHEQGGSGWCSGVSLAGRGSVRPTHLSGCSHSPLTRYCCCRGYHCPQILAAAPQTPPTCPPCPWRAPLPQRGQNLSLGPGAGWERGTPSPPLSPSPCL